MALRSENCQSGKEKVGGCRRTKVASVELCAFQVLCQYVCVCVCVCVCARARAHACVCVCVRERERERGGERERVRERLFQLITQLSTHSLALYAPLTFFFKFAFVQVSVSALWLNVCIYSLEQVPNGIITVAC